MIYKITFALLQAGCTYIIYARYRILIIVKKGILATTKSIGYALMFISFYLECIKYLQKFKIYSDFGQKQLMICAT